MSSSANRIESEPAGLVSAVTSSQRLSVRVRPTGEAVAAAGLLARTARRLDTPFHLRPTRRPTVTPDGTTVLVGYPDGVEPSHESAGDADADGTSAGKTSDADTPNGDLTYVQPGPEPASVRVAEQLRAGGIEPDPVLTLAGAVAGGSQPAGEPLEAAERADRLHRRPGVGVPTPDLATGLAYTTSLRLPVSNDPDAARELLETVGVAAEATPESLRRLASVVALDATSLDDERRPAERAVEATERTLHPHVTDEPFGSVEGYADVLETLAAADPGLALAAALEPEAVADRALDCWQTHGERVHAAVGDARSARYDGVFVLRVTDAADELTSGDATTDPERRATPLATVARLAQAFRSPEPRTLVVGDGHAAAVGSPDAPVGPPLCTAAESADGTAFGHVRATARFDGDVQAFLHGFREAVR